MPRHIHKLYTYIDRHKNVRNIIIKLNIDHVYEIYILECTVFTYVQKTIVQ